MLQPSPPVRFGGVGVCRFAFLAISAYLASAAGTLELQNSLPTDSQTLQLLATPAFGQIILVLLL
jgi:hypothetical protein